MAVLLLWTRPIASIHNIVTNHAGAHHKCQIGDYRDSGLVHQVFGTDGGRLLPAKSKVSFRLANGFHAVPVEVNYGSTEAVQTLALCNEAIISSGGVNAGEADYTKAMMKKLGDVAFWKIAMRPGRPMAVGHILRAKLASSPYSISASSYIKESDSKPSGSAILFGLTSNPVAVKLTFLTFVRPALLQMLGCTASAPPLLKARSAEAIRKKTGRTKYQRGTVNTLPVGSLQAKTTGNQGSGVLSSMVKANGLIVLDHGQGNVAPGDEVDEVMFDRHL